MRGAGSRDDRPLHVPPIYHQRSFIRHLDAAGVRVPAIIVSPWVEPGAVSHTTFDHTSIIKTILARFCPQALHERPPAGTRRTRLSPARPGLRTAQASHLGELLTRGTPRPAPSRDALVRRAAARTVPAPVSQPGPGSPAAADPPLNDLQQRILTLNRELQRRGHPPNTP